VELIDGNGQRQGTSPVAQVAVPMGPNDEAVDDLQPELVVSFTDAILQPVAARVLCRDVSNPFVDTAPAQAGQTTITVIPVHTVNGF